VYGETCTDAFSINSQGQIVGFASADCNVEDHAILWEKGSIVDVNALVSPASTLTVANAFDINDRGEVAGYAPLPNGDVHAVLASLKRQTSRKFRQRKPTPRQRRVHGRGPVHEC
jgi:probable HAF family extracellular repeat protein